MRNAFKNLIRKKRTNALSGLSAHDADSPEAEASARIAQEVLQVAFSDAKYSTGIKNSVN